MDGLGASPSLFGSSGRSRFDDSVHVLHQFELLPPEIFLLDEFLPGLVFLLSDALLLCFQPKGKPLERSAMTASTSTAQYYNTEY